MSLVVCIGLALGTAGPGKREGTAGSMGINLKGNSCFLPPAAGWCPEWGWGGMAPFRRALRRGARSNPWDEAHVQRGTSLEKLQPAALVDGEPGQHGAVRSARKTPSGSRAMTVR